MPDMNMNDNHYPHANFPLPNPPSALPNLTLDTGMSRTRDLVSGEYCQECLYTVEVPESVHAPFRSYYHEGLGSVFSVHDTPQANAFAPLESHSAMVPRERTFRDEATGELYVDARGGPIGQGAFGIVYEVKDKEGNRTALKVPKPTADMGMIRREAAFLERVKGHDNVAQLLGVVEDIRGPCLRMQLCEPRDFMTLLINRDPLPVAEIKFYAKQLVAGLAYIHKAGIRHCDIKPENVLVASGMQLKITDFGLSEESHDGILSTRKAGTPGYWAPEVMREEVHTDKIDIFSLGVIFYMMFTRMRPNITTEKAPICPPSNYLDVIDASEDAKDFVASSLQFNAVDRIAMPELVDHEFLHCGFCPKNLPDTAFDIAPTLENEAMVEEAFKGVALEGMEAEKHLRCSENSGEYSRTGKRKRRAGKKAVRGSKGDEKQGGPKDEHLDTRCMSNNKGKEVFHGFRAYVTTIIATAPAQDSLSRTHKKHGQDQDQEVYKSQTLRDEIRRFKQGRRAQRFQWEADLQRVMMGQAKMQQAEEELQDVLGSEFDEVNTSSSSSSSSSGSNDNHTTSNPRIAKDDREDEYSHDDEVGASSYSFGTRQGNQVEGDNNDHHDDADISSSSSSPSAPSARGDDEFVDYVSSDSASDVVADSDFLPDSEADSESGSQD